MVAKHILTHKKRFLALLPAFVTSFCISLLSLFCLLEGSLMRQYVLPGCTLCLFIGASAVYPLYRLLHWPHLVLRYIAHSFNGAAITVWLLVLTISSLAAKSSTEVYILKNHSIWLCLPLAASGLFLLTLAEHKRRHCIIKPEIIIEPLDK